MEVKLSVCPCGPLSFLSLGVSPEALCLWGRGSLWEVSDPPDASPPPPCLALCYQKAHLLGSLA